MSKIYSLKGYKPVERNENVDLDPAEQEITAPALTTVYETDDVREAATGFVDGGLLDGGLWVTVEEISVREDADLDANTEALTGMFTVVQKEKQARKDAGTDNGDDEAISKSSI